MKYMVVITYLNGMIVGFPVPDNKVCVSTMHKIVEITKETKFRFAVLECIKNPRREEKKEQSGDIKTKRLNINV
jgi:uncharacterized membrane protein